MAGKSLSGVVVLEPVFVLAFLGLAAAAAWLDPNATYPLLFVALVLGSLLRAMLPINEGSLATPGTAHWGRATGLRLTTSAERLCLVAVVVAGAGALAGSDTDLRAAMFTAAMTVASLRFATAIPIWSTR